MDKSITLKASDGHELGAWRAEPAEGSRGGIVVIQEIFGVNSHIRAVAEGFAADGYTVVAPALFDRVERGTELGYQPDDVTRGRELRGKISWEDALADIAAAAGSLDAARTAVVGYCWGGSLAWLSATRLDGISAAVCYYGGQINDFRTESPRCPVLMHFGSEDHGIPLDAVEAIRDAQPDLPIHVYGGAGHGFNCDQRGSFNAEAAAKARGRTLEFLAKFIG